MRLPERAIAGVSSALLPPEAGGPRTEKLLPVLTSGLERMGGMQRAAIVGALLAIDGYAIATTGRRLADQDEAGRDKVLGGLAAGHAGRDLVMAAKAFLLLMAGADQYRDEMIERANRFPPARPDPEMNVVSSSGWADDHRCDYVVIGSGAGGAMVARSLSRAGASVVIVEEGRRHGVEEFRRGHPIDRFQSMYRDAGATLALGRPPIALPIGRGVGGTTLVNSGTCYRTPARVMRRWRDAWGVAMADPAVFDPYLDDVWQTLQVAPAPADVIGRNAELAIEGAGRLGWKAYPLNRNAPGCAGSCQCAIGCPRNAKGGVHLNALPQACEAGAVIVSEARVTRVLTDRGRATGVLARRRDGSSFTIHTERVVLAAGATETPPLLARSGLARHRELGRNMAIHPALSLAGRMEEKVTPWHGVLQSTGVEELHDVDGILIEATSTPPGMGSMTLPGHGRRLLEEMARADHLMVLGAMVSDKPSGRVVGTPAGTLIGYSLAGDDAYRLKRALIAMGELAFAAGAHEVLTGIPGHETASDLDELIEAVRRTDIKALHLAAFHPTGTARMGRDPQRCPVRPDGRLRGVDGVWLADASILPSCPEVNPQVSIMAMSLAVADRMLDAT